MDLESMKKDFEKEVKDAKKVRNARITRPSKYWNGEETRVFIEFEGEE